MSEIKLVGDPVLRKVCEEVKNFNDDALTEEKKLLNDTLLQFRKENGFGRSIAAPQIGISKRFISLNLGKGGWIMFNPKITYKSEETFTMWDDCLSFPWILVEVTRHKQISLQYQDENGAKQTWQNLDQSTSELLQHEIDHLNGILALDQNGKIIAREVYNKDKDYFDSLVDFCIEPTI